jgi:transposase
MIQYGGCDVHKQFSVFAEIDEDGVIHGPTKVDQDTDELEEHLKSLPEGTPIAVETCGHWFWIVDRIEAMGHKPRLVNASRASKMMGDADKTDSLDAQGLAVLQKPKTLPEVWISEATQRDQRELLRLRMKQVQSRTRWKNQIQATLMKHGLDVSASDAFGDKGRDQLETVLQQVPEHSREVIRQQLGLLDRLNGQINAMEDRLNAVLEDSRFRELLATMPGIGRNL